MKKPTKDNSSQRLDSQSTTPLESKEQEDEGTEEFNYEVSSTEGVRDLSEEEAPTTPQSLSTIKILAEKNIPFKERPPPNYLPYFKCFLHYKNRPYKEGRRLATKE